jgi:hypothetical protein
VYNSEAKGIRVIYVKLYSFVPALVVLLLTSFYHHWTHVISTLQFEFTSCDLIMHIYVTYANTVIDFCDNSWAWGDVYCTAAPLYCLNHSEQNTDQLGEMNFGHEMEFEHQCLMFMSCIQGNVIHLK